MPESAGEIEYLRERLYTAVARACPAWLVAQRDDIVQVALLRLIESARRGEGIAGIRASYIQKTAHSALVDEIRRHRRRREVAVEEDSMARPLRSERADPEQERAAGEIGHAIRECLAGLIRPRALAVTLHLQGHTVAETARLLGWSAKRAENLVYRGLADLRRELEKRGFKP